MKRSVYPLSSGYRRREDRRPRWRPEEGLLHRQVTAREPRPAINVTIKKHRTPVLPEDE